MNFAGTMEKQDQKPIDASMSVFDVVFIRGWLLASAAMATMDVTFAKATSRALSAGAATMDATIMLGRLFVAAMATMDATLNNLTSRALDAAMSAFDVVFSAAHAVLVTLTAGMETMATTFSKQISKFFDAS
jgi:hypothetical protein